MKGKRILSVLLTLVLMLNIVLAVEGKAQAADDARTGIVNSEEMKEGQLKVTGKARNYDFTSFKAKTILNSESDVASYTYVNGLPMGYYDVMAISAANTGWTWLDAVINSSGATYAGVYVEVCDYDNLMLLLNGQEYSILSQKYCSVGNTYKNIGPVYMKSGTTYYVIVYNNNSDGNVNVGVRGKLYTTINRTLYQGTSKWTLASGKNKSQQSSTTWFKVKPDRTGVMAVSLKEYGYSSSYGTIRLYNSSKGTALSNAVTGSTAYFGVKKGTTYYLKVTDCCGTSEYNYKFGIKYGMTSRTDRDLNSKSEAKKLTRKADATNTLFKASTSTNTSATTDWYKIYVSSKRKTRLAINTSGMSSGEIYITVYQGSKKIGSSTLRAGYKNTYSIYNTYGDYATKGTYYIKIKKSKMCSGKYSIRYVQ